MTCIVAIKDKSALWMGADSAAVDGWYEKTIISEEKIFIGQTAQGQTSFLIGVAGYPRTLQLLRYKLNIPDIPANEKDLTRYMVLHFVESMRTCFREAGHARKKDNEEEFDSEVIIGICGRIFTVNCNYQLIESKKPYDAIGCGTDYALGVLYTTEKDTPRKRIKKALEAAAYFNAGVSEPFVIKKLEYV